MVSPVKAELILTGAAYPGTVSGLKCKSGIGGESRDDAQGLEFPSACYWPDSF